MVFLTGLVTRLLAGPSFLVQAAAPAGTFPGTVEDIAEGSVAAGIPGAGTYCTFPAAATYNFASPLLAAWPYLALDQPSSEAPIVAGTPSTQPSSFSSRLVWPPSEFAAAAPLLRLLA